MKITIAWLYPDILNLHGDRGNVMALLKIAEAMNIETEIIKVNTAKDFPAPAKIDLIVMGAGQLRDMQYLSDDLKKCADKLRTYIENDGYMLVTGSTGCLLGSSCKYNDKVIEGLGIVDLTSGTMTQTRQPMLPTEVYGDDIYWKTDDGMEIIGCQIQRLDMIPGKSASALGTILYGYGNNGNDGKEGVRYRNVLITNTVGPLLPCNPWLGIRIFGEIASAKGERIPADFDESKVPFTEYAKSAFELKKAFLRDKKKVNGIDYKGQ